jgi:hypothetical protein
MFFYIGVVLFFVFSNILRSALHEFQPRVYSFNARSTEILFVKKKLREFISHLPFIAEEAQLHKYKGENEAQNAVSFIFHVLIHMLENCTNISHRGVESPPT